MLVETFASPLLTNPFISVPSVHLNNNNNKNHIFMLHVRPKKHILSQISPFSSSIVSHCSRDVLPFTPADCRRTAARALRSRRPRGSLPRCSLLPVMLLMCSDTRDTGRGRALSTRHDRNASYNHKRAPTNSASDINCIRHRVGRKQFCGQMARGAASFYF